VSCVVRTEYVYVTWKKVDGFCGIVVRALGYRSRGPFSISGADRFFKSSERGTWPTQLLEYN
jgi:hypothetical protein